MIYTRKITKLFATILFASLTLNMTGQSVNELIAAYSGDAEWSSSTSTLTFKSTGVVKFGSKSSAKQHFWDIPSTVNTILILADVQVTCAFHANSSVTIKGIDRKTSVVYGTDLQEWAQKSGVKAFEHCQFQNFGGTMTIQNLTSKNPFGFHVRGWGTKMMVSYCDFLDTRGGHGNHSDGIEGGDGSVIDNCYFETGDDIFKIYFDNTITNCTVNMVQNAVPIQLGWGNYSNGAVGTIKNLTIFGNSGRGNKDTYPVICGRKGIYDVTVNIDSCTIINPNAHLVMLWDDNEDGNYEKTLRGSITNAFIDIKGYSNYLYGTSLLQVCGSAERSGDYNCLTPSNINLPVVDDFSVYPNPTNEILYLTSLKSYTIYDLYGHKISLNSSFENDVQVLDLQTLSRGVYLIQVGNSVNRFIKL